VSQVLALCGGVGGAKLAAGLADLLPPDELIVAVNTGDDFEHLGLHICPDIDSTLYALSGLNDVERGWGRRDETWNFMSSLGELGGPTWFRLGDRDLATHLQRTARRATGASNSEVTRELASAMGIACRVVPMSDDPVRTMVVTDEGTLAFQEYFVRRQCEPAVRAIEYHGAQDAALQPDILDTLRSPDLSAIVICPSNPWLSIGPLLAMPSLRKGLQKCTAPVIAVSPLIGGRAVKGPTAKIMRELDLPTSAAGIARCYLPLLSTLVIDSSDAAQRDDVLAEGCEAVVTGTLMRDREDRLRLARVVLDAASGN
jgi:LPPG:FO 2-phospho-L-lactate transferase